MVFEYMEQDLDKFIRQSRLDHKLTKVINVSNSNCCCFSYDHSYILVWTYFHPVWNKGKIANDMLPINKSDDSIV